MRAALAESAQAKRATAEACAPAIAEAALRIAATFRAGGRVLTFGNGGSAADAQHLAAELAGRYERERPGLPALALTANTSDLTAIGNDYGFDEVFARLVRAHGRPGDLAVAISTSGRSPNVLGGVAAAREAGLTSLALTGKGGGKLAAAADLAIVVPSDVTARIQECHIAVIHLLCELCDDALFPGPGRR
ncbi:MAG TPA: SIS domain-containing protein [Myxococcota bacterium]|nr:SIS domain-containing protein [Myxococcota bacterium]